MLQNDREITISSGAASDVLRRLESLGCGYCVYSTRKHQPDATRLRVLLPLVRTATADEYGPAARMLAKQGEARIVKGVRELGGLAYKFVSPGNVGVPDRLVILPGGRILFAELKAEGGRLSTVQLAQIDKRYAGWAVRCGRFGGGRVRKAF